MKAGIVDLHEDLHFQGLFFHKFERLYRIRTIDAQDICTITEAAYIECIGVVGSCSDAAVGRIDFDASFLVTHQTDFIIIDGNIKFSIFELR